MLDLQPVDFLGPVPAELFQRFDHWEVSGLDAAGNGALAQLLELSLHQLGQIIQVAPRLLSRLLRPLGIVGFKEGQVERIEMLR